MLTFWPWPARLDSKKNRQIAPATEFKPLDLRYFRGPHVNTTQPRHIGHQGKAQNNLSEALMNS
jgi:hypothetical protein